MAWRKSEMAGMDIRKNGCRDYKPKITHIVEAFGGGVFAVMADIVDRTRQDFDITVLYGGRYCTPEGFERYFDRGVRFVEIENFTREISIRKDVKAFLEIRARLKEIQPDIVHLHSSKAGALGRFAVPIKNRRIIYNPHSYAFLNTETNALKRFVYKTAEKAAALRNCVIVACSEGEYKEAVKLSTDVRLIRNGVDIRGLGAEIERLPDRPFDPANIKFCTCGRITAQKNPSVFNEVAESFPRHQFTWIGDGELRGLLTAPNIQITGWRSREYALTCMNDHDVFLLPSLFEGLPIALLEAMFLKKLCVAFDVIGTSDVIYHNKNGYLCCGTDDFKDAIRSILNGGPGAGRMRDNARDSVVTSFNADAMAESYRALYTELMADTEKSSANYTRREFVS
ncbi:MAG: glycosyltransferase [Clostridiales bacterium]|jgi:glycosyltransferase involved in cell wall biosynthesis|nr:glycosyltransferase [Clostridiales bacterium]